MAYSTFPISINSLSTKKKSQMSFNLSFLSRNFAYRDMKCGMICLSQAAQPPVLNERKRSRTFHESSTISYFGYYLNLLFYLNLFCAWSVIKQGNWKKKKRNVLLNSAWCKTVGVFTKEEGLMSNISSCYSRFLVFIWYLS